MESKEKVEMLLGKWRKNRNIFDSMRKKKILLDEGKVDKDFFEKCEEKVENSIGMWIEK